MNLKLFSLLAMLVIMAIAAMGCTDGDNGNKPTNYPVDVKTTDFETTCNWQNLKQDTVYIINSKEELQTYLSCEESNFPDVDFNKYSLIVVFGTATSRIANLTKQLQQTAAGEYELMIDITLDMTTVDPAWYVSILTEKLPKDAKFTLDVKYGGEDEYKTIDSIKIIPSNPTASDDVKFAIFSKPFGGGCTYHMEFDSTQNNKIYISGKYESMAKCMNIVNDTISLGKFPVGSYQIVYSFVDVCNNNPPLPPGYARATETYTLDFTIK